MRRTTDILLFWKFKFDNNGIYVEGILDRKHKKKWITSYIKDLVYQKDMIVVTTINESVYILRKSEMN